MDGDAKTVSTFLENVSLVNIHVDFAINIIQSLSLAETFYSGLLHEDY